MPTPRRSVSSGKKPIRKKVNVKVGAKMKKKGIENDSTRQAPTTLPRNNMINFKIKVKKKEK